MSAFYRLFPAVCAVAALVPLSVRSQELPLIGPVQQLPMPPATVRPTQTAHFGEQVFTDGFTTLVTVDDGPYAYTYVKNTSGQWRYQAALPVLPGTAVSGPGALRGNVALVQTAGRFDSSVLVFLRSNGQWRHTQTLPSPDLRSFGRVNNLAIGPNYIAIGNPLARNFSGTVSVYKQEAPGIYGGDFGAPQILDLSEPRGAGAPASNLWGMNPIGIGDRLMIAELLGSVYEFTRNSTGFWSYSARFSRDDGLIVTDRYAFATGNLVLDWQDPPFIDVFVPEALILVNGVWQGAGGIFHPTEQRGTVRTPLAVYGRRLIIDRQLFLYERNTFQGVTRWSGRAELAAPGCGRVGGVAKYDARPYGVVMVDTLAMVACPGANTSDTIFEGNVVVYTLPPLLSPSANLVQ